MLEAMELDDVFRHASVLGWTFVEVFVDASLRATYRIQNRLDSVEIHQSGGIALRCVNGSRSQVLLLPHTDSKGLIAALDGKFTSDASLTNQRAFQMTPTETASNKSRLQQWFRSAFGESEATLKASAEMVHTFHRFFVANSNGHANEDFREQAELEVSWHSAPTAPPTQWAQRRYNVRDVMDKLKDSSALKEAIRVSRAKQSNWPAPEGSLPLAFSANAVSKFLLPLISHFESDRVLSESSFLNRWPEELPLAFDLEETSQELPGSASDAEATLHRSFFLFRDGKPRGLACSRKTAEALGVDATGHVLRNSFRYPGIIALRRVSLVPKKSPANPPEGLERGLWVNDLEAAISLSSIPRIHLGIRSAHLIHHGQIGERVEGFHIECPLAEFLTAFESGGIDAETFGLSTFKMGQRALVEIHTPSLITSAFPIPGKVPASHYW